jgi:hypothetical protein
MPDVLIMRLTSLGHSMLKITGVIFSYLVELMVDNWTQVRTRQSDNKRRSLVLFR